MNNELYHWKYIKREKVNGKWQYTYDNPKNYKETVVDTNRLFSKKYKTTDFKGQYHTLNQRGKIERYIDNAKRDMSEAKAKITTNNPNDRMLDSDRFFSSTRSTKTSSGKNVDIKLRGKLERNAAIGLEYIKDRLGYDESKAYFEAVARDDIVNRKKTTAADNASDAHERMKDAELSSAERTQAKRDFKRAVDSYQDASNKRESTYKMRKETREAFYSTPLGKITEFNEYINAAEDYISDLFKKKRKK